MIRDTTFDVQTDIISAKRYDEVVMIYLKENFLFRSVDLSAKGEVFNYLDRLIASDSIKVVVFLAAPQKAGRDEYVAFYRKYYAHMDRSSVLRMYNAVNQFIMKIITAPKIFIHAFMGKSILMFLNLGLACDYRVMAENAVFQNPCMELGLIPKGGGAYFLTRTIGPGKALELLLSCEDITAERALRLGLVEKVVPAEEVEEAVLTVAQVFAHQPTTSLSGVKRLVSYFHTDLKDFLEIENQELIKIFDSGDMTI